MHYSLRRLPLFVPVYFDCAVPVSYTHLERELKPLLDEVAAAYQKVLGIVERLD